MNTAQKLIAKLFCIPLPEPKEPIIPLASREAWRLTLDEWRRQDQMVLESRTLARNPTYRAQLDVLRNSHPCHTLFTPLGVSPTDRIVHQAKCEGYELALNNLEAMTKPIKSSRPLEATFAAPEETTNDKGKR